MLPQLIKELEKIADPKQAEISRRFFKTGQGEYGEGDIFLGIKVPVLRQITKNYYNLSLPKIQELLKSEIHEHRMVGIFILNQKYKKASEDEKANIFNFYMINTKRINNWDLVDLSAPNIVGDFLFDKKKNILYELVRSENLWERRIAIISTFAFIRKNEFKDGLAISELLLGDSHDLIHKAVGWMLREVGKREQEVEEKFLKAHYKKMPRTMLRYAIEKFEEGKRQGYLKGEI